ncbi:MAG: MaoC family dehydratase N-terminal domain-containing protein [Acidimicrobiia bacterium]
MPESLITDEMRKMLGVESPTYTFEVEKGDVARYAQAIGDDNPLFTDEQLARRTRYGGMIAPPTYLIVMRVLEIGVAPPFRPLSNSLDGGSEWQYFHPIRPGDRISATSKLADLYERDGSLGRMLFVVTEITYRNQFDEIVVIQRDTAICFGE